VVLAPLLTRNDPGRIRARKPASVIPTVSGEVGTSRQTMWLAASRSGSEA
jgi:hypothetical protein